MEAGCLPSPPSLSPAVVTLCAFSVDAPACQGTCRKMLILFCNRSDLKLIEFIHNAQSTVGLKVQFCYVLEADRMLVTSTARKMVMLWSLWAMFLLKDCMHFLFGDH